MLSCSEMEHIGGNMMYEIKIFMNDVLVDKLETNNLLDTRKLRKEFSEILGYKIEVYEKSNTPDMVTYISKL